MVRKQAAQRYRDRVESRQALEDRRETNKDLPRDMYDVDDVFHTITQSDIDIAKVRQAGKSKWIVETRRGRAKKANKKEKRILTGLKSEETVKGWKSFHLEQKCVYTSHRTEFICTRNICNVLFMYLWTQEIPFNTSCRNFFFCSFLARTVNEQIYFKLKIFNAICTLHTPFQYPHMCCLHLASLSLIWQNNGLFRAAVTVYFEEGNHTTETSLWWKTYLWGEL